MTPHILILAAGASSRMRGADKLLEPVAGEPLLRRVARLAAATGVPVTVALPPDRPGRAAALEGVAADRVIVPNPGDGMSASLAAGLAALPANAAVILLLADLPEITTEDLLHMLRHWQDNPDQILRATDATGRPGHPVCFPAWVREELLTLRGDEGARPVLQRHNARVGMVVLPGHHATTDLDTPEDWATWRTDNP